MNKMEKCITIFKHFVTLVFTAICAYEVSHVITKWIKKESFQGKTVLEINSLIFHHQFYQKGKKTMLVLGSDCPMESSKNIQGFGHLGLRICDARVFGFWGFRI